LFAYFTSGFSSSFDLFTVGTAAASMIRGIRAAAGNSGCRRWTQHIASPGGGHSKYFRWKDGGGVNVLIAVRNLSFFQKEEDNSKQPAKKVPAGGSGYGNGNSNFEEAARKSQNMALKATAMGAGLNLVLFVSKGITGYLVNSTALMADAFGSLGDLCTDAIVYYSVEQARKAASPDRPWGLGKMEPIGNHCVVVMNSNALLMLLSLCRCLRCEWYSRPYWSWHWIHRYRKSVAGAFEFTGIRRVAPSALGKHVRRRRLLGCNSLVS
jgi:hypothetical protein